MLTPPYCYWIYRITTCPHVIGSNVTKCVLTVFILWLMAPKETPKKRYLKSTTAEVYSSSWLCKALVDKNHCKSSNRTVLKNVEDIYGNNLHKDNNLPHLICRLCERRLTSAITFKSVIIKTQKSLEQEIRSKRCLEISPSVVQPSASRVRASVSSSTSGRRRSLHFVDSCSATSGVSLLIYLYLMRKKARFNLFCHLKI